MKPRLAWIMLLLIPGISFANPDLITWKGIYYRATPQMKNITKQYCQEHTPGSFIHVVKDALSHPVYTDKGIKLDRASFAIDKVGDIYLIHGDFIATGKANNQPWQDHVYYFLYKYSEAGLTRGIWYTNECKGLYKGIAVKNENQN